MALENEVVVKLNDLFSALSKRERIIVLLALFLIPIYLFAELVFLPAQKEQKLLTTQYQTAQQDVVSLQQQLLELESALNNDPDQGKRDQLASLREQITSFDQSLQRNLAGLVPPQQMAAMLRGMLSQHKGLTLISLKNRVPSALVAVVTPAPEGKEPPTSEELVLSQKTAPVLYQHGIEVQLTGSYLDTLHYLHQLQGLSHRLFWQSVDIEMSDRYPSARVLLNVYTLSFQEGWIGG
ncbi:MAG: hypothetical protein B6I37_04710 [Desulfobacteraceae bacterium 4572_35.2]|nr:MAG: hypothetical protein B6I37_04710 [Desulfobacteraceae bacterium 4572_35.2]